jgi:hypothetical protein
MEITINPFARTLLFYHLYLRAKLNSNDLLKISNKYASKPTYLLRDLQAKYTLYFIPESVSATELCRLISLYNVPEDYCKLLNIEKWEV